MTFLGTWLISVTECYHSVVKQGIDWGFVELVALLLTCHLEGCRRASIGLMLHKYLL